MDLFVYFQSNDTVCNMKYFVGQHDSAATIQTKNRPFSFSFINALSNLSVLIA